MQLNEHVLQVSGISTNNNTMDSSIAEEYEEPLSSSPNNLSKKSKTRKINLDSIKPSKAKKLKLSKGHEFVMTVNSPKEVHTGHR